MPVWLLLYVYGGGGGTSYGQCNVGFVHDLALNKKTRVCIDFVDCIKEIARIFKR